MDEGKKGHIVVLTGAGISAESGLKTFRDSGGLWESYRIEDVASPNAWMKDPELVLDFYNMRRSQLSTVKPNTAHEFLAELEEEWEVSIITQNVDDLHERGGSSSILHLHGELRKVRSIGNPGFIQDIGYGNLELGQLCPEGHQLRPHIVWFGEEVPKMTEAQHITHKADIFLIIGTSLNVYPAAGLIHATSMDTPVIVVDPDPSLQDLTGGRIEVLTSKATEALGELAVLLERYSRIND